MHFEPTTKGIVTHLAFMALTQNINWFTDQMFHSCKNDQSVTAGTTKHALGGGPAGQKTYTKVVHHGFSLGRHGYKTDDWTVL